MRDREPLKYNTAAYVREQLRRTELIRKQIIEQHRSGQKKKPEPEQDFEIVLLPYTPKPKKEKLTKEQIVENIWKGRLRAAAQREVDNKILRQEPVFDPTVSFRGPKDCGITVRQSNIDEENRKKQHFVSSLDRYLSLTIKRNR